MAHDRQRGLLRAAPVLSLCCGMLIGLQSRVDAARCLTPAAEHALKDVLATGALQRVLGSALALKRLNLSAAQIELGVEDTSGRPYAVSLTLPESGDRRPDGRGTRFAFQLSSTARENTDVTRTLLAAAELVDHSVPDSAFAECGGEPPSPEAALQQPQRDHAPRSRSLVSGAIQVLILAAATLFGLWTARARNG